MHMDYSSRFYSTPSVHIDMCVCVCACVFVYNDYVSDPARTGFTKCTQASSNSLNEIKPAIPNEANCKYSN